VNVYHVELPSKVLENVLPRDKPPYFWENRHNLL